jgi:hypothetical protein
MALGGWVVLTGLAAFLVPSIPARSVRTTAAEGMAVGAVHMHTAASDGGGSIDDLVDAAVVNGLDFIVVTDHNTLEPTRYEYRSGVLVIHGEEVSTTLGHVIMLDVDTVRLTEPDTTEVRWNLEHHRDFGDAGARFAAHPNGRRWWLDRAAETVDGMEIWNADSEWRNDTVGDWLEALTLLPFRPSLAMLALVDRPDRNLALFDSAAVNRTVATTCSVDAHARIDITDDWYIGFPSYPMTLALLHQHVALRAPLSGDAEADGRMLTSSMVDGAGHCAVGGIADDGAVRIAESDGIFSVSVPDDVARPRIRVLRNGEVIAEEETSSLEVPATEPGMYRAEIEVRARLLRTRWFPWILSGPIWVGPRPDDPPAWMLGTFEDDYGNRYEISEDSWVQEPGMTYEVERWMGSHSFMFARNAADNASDPGLWTRIDWVELGPAAETSGAEWTWGFCLASWNAGTFSQARATETADRSEPRTGCGGFPFSRMRRIE